MGIELPGSGIEANQAADRSEVLARIGVEVGGTFTDFIAIEGDEIRLLKVPSTPAEPERAVVDALDASGVDVSQVADFVHGSTVATNTILERRGAPTAFVATSGFRDILEIQRHDRRQIFAIDYQKPLPIVMRQHCFEVRERIDGKGHVVLPLDLVETRSRLIPALKAGGFTSVAICLLNAHENGAHEEQLAALIREELDLLVTTSSSIVREFREYERASTTVLSTYVQPVINRYLGRLEEAVSARGFGGKLSIMQSNGGRIPIDGMRQSCISAFLSGPAAGVVGAIRQASRSNIDDIITFDMGGTSSDVCLVSGGHAEIAVQSEVDGLPIRYPMTDIVTIGAGGGSIVSVDDGGMLHVGPHSAGARPGPACYGRGGTLPTLTDAHVICGTLQPHTFLGGTMPLDREAAFQAFEPIARLLGTTVEAAADGALSLAASNIVRAIQTVSTERGRDPRDYALMPFGGAGPLCATEIADELGADRVIVPPNPGVMSAFGLLAADHMIIDVASVREVVEAAAIPRLQAQIASMAEDVADRYAAMQMGGGTVHRIQFDMRFAGQAFELQVGLTPEELATLTAPDLARRFKLTYAGVFMNTDALERAIEIISVRLISIKENKNVPVLRWTSSLESSDTVVPVYRSGRRQQCRELTVDLLSNGASIDGPVLIVSDTSSVFADAGWRVRRDDGDNLLLTKVAS
ncbi:hydantoinase/oxoprolinase family protein [Pseudoxanthobacter sp. M-2]|uniref:hydantoinase/oxoprolinase family protein n=1 Tax=Pseudoxanthobacter sp. M-2 TaxID=3078754 RepID=UPI0038FD18C1